MSETKSFELEINKITGKPICYLIWRIDLVNSDCTLSVIVTNIILAKEYMSYMKKCEKDKDNRIRFHIEKREMNHVFADTMMDVIGLPLKETPNE